VDPDTAQSLQQQKLVQVNVAPAFNIATDDRLI
jgi:hypothetical protein